MDEITYLPEVECLVTNENGLLDTEIVAVPDESGDQQYLRIGKGIVTRERGKTYLGVGIVDLDHRKRRALVELPQEADSGVRRLWVPFERFRPLLEQTP